ncbi:UDP-4-amino-4,6-dideoxy-N-acetyl-beta-L-altrosamine transaminase [Solirubrobacter phytolaccae]|uniref:UDP-4-amino-4, 6-dideoxy-N-acetyl-beta-L-altrosamine transaminase n=1 Tax=Solirubrobacter phytolaccae TaxID=1404360 RepID=A0A9X3NC99_9ACTN|nr:UDP-4-amino-4,6-dideoxy-N-acetyl-beta-L-altrosamine transaminase [Solirubrobacter phytolaccae]MDA0183823.1 UDP-4-amino-4,6-dideoxy-N-acetyl-beta-L-altrosamine transaminase [Solirubrobacter phytolaccae]
MIPYGRQTIEDDDVAAVLEALRSDFLTQGPRVAAFEAQLAELAGTPYAVAFSSGTAALHAACFAAGAGPGDEVVTSALTFAASANCAAYVGATPVFADIDPATWNVSAETVAAVVSERTRAVIPVSFTGLPAPIAEIRAAVGPDVVVIEDAAHAIGGRRAGRPVGADADMTVFSFHPVKTVTTGEGGAITLSDPKLYQRLLDFRSHGMTKDPARLERPDEGGWYMEQHLLGFNYRITDLQCALGSSQLAKTERFVAARNAIAARYREELAGVVALPPEVPADSLHAYHLFVISVAERRRVYDALRERGVLAQIHYLPVYLHPYYRDTYGYAPGLCPEAETYYEGCLSLPCFPGLTEDEQTTVITAVRDIVGA